VASPLTGNGTDAIVSWHQYMLEAIIVPSVLPARRDESATTHWRLIGHEPVEVQERSFAGVAQSSVATHFFFEPSQLVLDLLSAGR
jgi:hypothetical protein